VKLIIFLMGMGTLLAVTGCESDEHERREHHRGGVYDDSYRHYGHEAYPYDRDRDWDHDRWDHRY